MGHKAAIVIAVGKAGSLTPLEAAASDAAKFADWADKNEYEPHLIDDSTKAVSAGRVKAVVKEVLKKDLDRLLIFFTGHGTSTGATDYWLLTDYDTDSNEAINVIGSLNNAKRLPIRQIGVFADACRSAVPEIASITGSVIFPRAALSAERRPTWDQFYATVLGDISQEVPGDADLHAYGIFSRCLIKALRGQERSLLEHRDGKDVVCSDRLADWIEESVPLESGRTPNARVQLPDVHAGWRRPDDIYLEVESAPPASPASPAPAGMSSWMSGLARAIVPPSPPSPDTGKASVERARANLENRIQTAANSLEIMGRHHFESGRGLTIHGTEILRVFVKGGRDVQLFPEDGAQHVRGHQGVPQTVVLETAAGTWIPSVIIPEFIGVLTVNEGLATGFNYQKIGAPDPQIDNILRRWTALMTINRVPKDELRQIALLTRDGKHDNPALGVLASYAYERAGDLDEIDSIVGYFADLGQPVLFDLALLSSFAASRDSDGRPAFVDGVRHKGEHRPAQIAASFPLLARGWAMLDTAEPDPLVHPALPGLRPGVLNSLWVSLKHDEGKVFAELVETGDL